MKTNNYTATVKLPSGIIHQYHYEATSIAEAYRYMLLDMRSDKSSFIDLSLTKAIPAYNAIDRLERPQEEKALVKHIIHHLLEHQRTTMARSELIKLGLDVSQDTLYKLVTAAGYPYNAYISYCKAVNLDSVSLNF
jgi:hypothetical protein